MKYLFVILCLLNSLLSAYDHPIETIKYYKQSTQSTYNVSKQLIDNPPSSYDEVLYEELIKNHYRLEGSISAYEICLKALEP